MLATLPFGSTFSSGTQYARKFCNGFPSCSIVRVVGCFMAVISMSSPIPGWKLDIILNSHVNNEFPIAM